MLEIDRVVLRNVMLVMVASTGSLLIVGTTCLGREGARFDSLAGGLSDAARSSAGGVPATAVGRTTITSATVAPAAPSAAPRPGFTPP